MGIIADSPSRNTSDGLGVDYTTAAGNAETVAIIHQSRLFRDCLCFALSDAAAKLIDYPSVDAWRESNEAPTCRLILIALPNLDIDDDARQISTLFSHAGSAHVVATGDSEDADFILDLLSKGLRGYIPSSLPLDVSIGALRIVHAGGVFVPADCLLALPRQVPRAAAKQTGFEMFTSRQLAVIEAIRKGKPNKIIAYELNMCESTVKVHVRTIMKKMQARNRTQVAMIANNVLDGVTV